MVSIVMPAYNVEKYIAESIRSIQEQSYGDWELLIVDDDSSDGTAEIIAAFMETDQRIRYLRKENEGVSAARNAGLAMAQGEYISFLDADDLWDREFLEKMLAKAGQQSKFVYARTEEFFPDGRKNIVGPEDCVRGRLEAFMHRTGELRLRFHISAVLVAKALIDEYGLAFPVGIKQSEDTAFFIQVLCLTEADFVPEVLSHYRRRAASATTVAWRPEDWDGAVIIYERLEDFVRQHYPEGWLVFTHMRDYVAYRFVLKCLRHHCKDEAARYIERWRAWLAEFAAGRGKLNDRLKCRLFLLNNRKLNSLAGRL